MITLSIVILNSSGKQREIRDVSNKYVAQNKYTDWRQRHIEAAEKR